jgi:hypothetical protein
MAKYAWRLNGPTPKIEADIFGRALEDIASGKPLESVAPDEIVNAARTKRSPIHSLFNWDNDKAAELYRRVQARHYVGALQIVRVEISQGPTVSNRAYYSVPSVRGYIGHDKVLSDRDLRKQVIASAKHELESYVIKYQGVLALGSVVPRLQEAIDEMRDEIDRLESEALPRRRADNAAGEVSIVPANT